MKKIECSPIDLVTWVDPNNLQANDYNPNQVAKVELDLLKFSIEKNGWIQPVLITTKNIIIDGFHRVLLAKKMEWLVPCVALELSEPERMYLTIRINRAKGTHVAFKMADIIKKLVKDHGQSAEVIMKNIGATKEEVSLLMLEDIFERFDVKNHVYNPATIPGEAKEARPGASGA